MYTYIYILIDIHKSYSLLYRPPARRWLPPLRPDTVDRLEKCDLKRRFSMKIAYYQPKTNGM
jgi:hypothetical protein